MFLWPIRWAFAMSIALTCKILNDLPSLTELLHFQIPSCHAKFSVVAKPNPEEGCAKELSAECLNKNSLTRLLMTCSQCYKTLFALEILMSEFLPNFCKTVEELYKNFISF